MLVGMRRAAASAVARARRCFAPLPALEAAGARLVTVAPSPALQETAGARSLCAGATVAVEEAGVPRGAFARLATSASRHALREQ